MHPVKSTASLAVALLLSACGGPATAESLGTATDSAALTSAFSQGCTFSMTYQQTSSTSHPPLFEPVITRQASSTCPWPSASVVLAGSYSEPGLSIAANDLGVAVSYTYKYSPSGSSGVYLELRHLTPDTLSVVRSTTLYAHDAFRFSKVYRGELSLLADGSTLQVQGTKEGTIPFESGNGSNYIATYPDFFTSTTTPTVVAY
ncbi:hypothetical protein [Melittangium boletus]|uniref:Lipoprotein n=1 Tax=Melittangium boletus DSM 14713 TaxID=1294270 RepID=A0A250IBM8_9BACT|nr:hypothetical protein [Melittangium boletus]ATB29249.1 hypothetical protein MEBOL_002698 [Melittangium boletus DSM 14713]